MLAGTAWQAVKDTTNLDMTLSQLGRLAIQLTVGLNNFRIGTDGVQGNQVQGITRRGLEVLNLNFYPNPTRD